MLLLRIEQNGNPVEFELPLPAHFLRDELQAAGFDRPTHEILLNEVDYEPLNEQGKQLLIELSPYESLAAANLACTLLTVPDITASMREVVESARRLLPRQQTETMTFYCPIAVNIADEDGNLEEGDRGLLREAEDEIRSVLRGSVPEGENMAWHMGRCGQALQEKVASAVWDAGKYGGDIYGVVRCELRAPLTAEEKQELSDWIRLQNEGGIGETAEQIPIETEYHALYISFNCGGYPVLDQSQFEQYLNGGGQEMAPQKPDCPLIGQDGNVFNLIGIAARTLRENGLADQAKEMRTRAMDSGSYDQALGVIMEYVNVTSVYDDMDEDDDWCREPEYNEQDFGGMGGLS